MTINALRIELLRDALETAVDALYRRHASEIPDGYIEDYVSLDWMEWRGGGLRLTTTGENVCIQLRRSGHEKSRSAAAAAAH